MKQLNLTKEQYNYVKKHINFDESKNEKIIFELWYKGYNNCYIAKTIKCSEGTIRNRKAELKKKMNFYLSDSELSQNMFCVYLHKFPNNKVYVGMTSDISKRWNNGLGYKENEIMFEDIIRYGWDNIEHLVVADNLLYEEAIKLENNIIIEYKSYDGKYGYNIRYIKDK